MKFLLIEPEFPITTKSKNHKNFLPIGLLKISDYLDYQGHETKIIRGFKSKQSIGTRFKPKHIFITSLFTYWAKSVKDCVSYYRKLYPDSKVTVGGIYATLMPEHCLEYTNCDEVFEGTFDAAEKYAAFNKLNYSKLENHNPIDFQIIHSSRGCRRKCGFCGTWKLEPEFISKNTIKNEIIYRKLIFYDNNFLMNKYINIILDELIELKTKKKILWCESQSGFDGRVLLKKPNLSKKIKIAGFRYPRIAWDGKFSNYKMIKKQIDSLINVGYRKKDMYIFMIYNWNISFDDMELKRKKCWEWGIQIADCRFRPINQTFDNYEPQKKQSNKDYFIHNEWTDKKIKEFRRKVRRQNICIRQNLSFYSKTIENKRLSKTKIIKLKKMDIIEAKKHLNDIWIPDD